MTATVYSYNVHPCVAEKPYLPEIMIGTLTSSIFKSEHILISFMISCKLYFVATPGHPKPFPLENYRHIIALTPNLQKVSFYSIIEFHHHSPTTKLILILKYTNGSYPSSKALYLCRKSLSALWLLHDRHEDLYLGSKRVTISV
jgi:hypothetical protein